MDVFGPLSTGSDLHRRSEINGSLVTAGCIDRLLYALLIRGVEMRIGQRSDQHRLELILRVPSQRIWIKRAAAGDKVASRVIAQAIAAGRSRRMWPDGANALRWIGVRPDRTVGQHVVGAVVSERLCQRAIARVGGRQQPIEIVVRVGPTVLGTARTADR